MSPRTRIIDLTHVVEDGMVTYPGLPAPEVGVHLTREASRAVYAQGTTFEIGRISMVTNTGTYYDAPLHRFAAGDDLTQVPLDRVAAVPGLVIDVRDRRHHRRHPARAHHAAGRGGRGPGAPDEPRRPAGRGLRAARRPGAGPRPRDLSGTGLRRGPGRGRGGAPLISPRAGCGTPTVG